MDSFARKFFSKNYEDRLLTLLRYTLSLIFIWFGVLKVLGYNPVFELVFNSALPIFADGIGLIVLGVIEAIIGVFLFINRAIFLTHFVVLLHLLGTFSTFIFGWNIVFDPYFPILSLDGEFVIKNITLAIAGLVILVHESRKRRSD